MRVIYISNYLNFHQTVFFDSFVKQDVDFTFLSTSFSFENIKPVEDRDYCKQSQNIKDDEVRSFLNSFDILIYGACEDKRLIKQMPKDKIIFHNSEHFWKKINDPISLTKRIGRMLELKLRYRKVNNLYLLANSSRLTNELKRDHIKFKKSFRFAYFPPVCDSVNLDDKNIYDIVYIGRLLKLKIPEYSTFVLKSLKEKSNEYNLSFYGEGPEKGKISSLEDSSISVKGFISHDEALNVFKKSSIFCFSSNREEGWGAVLNESLSAGCIVFACEDAGSTNFLIRDGINGFSFKTKKELLEKVEKFKTMSINEVKLMRENAVLSMKNLWDAKIAASRLYVVLKDIYNNKEITLFENGPLSIIC